MCIFEKFLRRSNSTILLPLSGGIIHSASRTQRGRGLVSLFSGCLDDLRRAVCCCSRIFTVVVKAEEAFRAAQRFTACRRQWRRLGGTPNNNNHTARTTRLMGATPQTEVTGRCYQILSAAVRLSFICIHIKHYHLFTACVTKTLLTFQGLWMILLSSVSRPDGQIVDPAGLKSVFKQTETVNMFWSSDTSKYWFSLFTPVK